MPENSSVNSAGYFIEGTLERFDGKMAVIITKDGQQLFWPIANLPSDIEAGQPVRLVLSTSLTDVADKEKMAKIILNEILKNTDQGNVTGAEK